MQSRHLSWAGFAFTFRSEKGLDEHHPAKPKNYSSFPLAAAPPRPLVEIELDSRAISIPSHASGEPPAGLMIRGCAMHDDTILNIARQAEAALARAIHP